MKLNVRACRQKIVAVLILCICLGLAGCTQLISQPQEKTKVDYTVVKENEIPKDLAEQIEGEKGEEFHITYNDTEYLYIAVGYGEQETGGYSVAVAELYTADQKIHMKTKLIGPRKGEQVNHSKTYPHLVIKLEQREEGVYFE